MLAKPRNNRTLGAERERRSQVKLRKRVESRQAGDRTRGSRTQGFAAADRLRGGQESLNAVAEELAHGGLASRASHDSQVRTWCAIGRRAGIEPFPLAKVTVGVILRCFKDGGYRSPEQYLSAARRHHTESKYGAIAADAELAMRDMLRNVTRNMGEPERREPVEVEHLIALR